MAVQPRARELKGAEAAGGAAQGSPPLYLGRVLMDAEAAVALAAGSAGYQPYFRL